MCVSGTRGLELPRGLTSGEPFRDICSGRGTQDKGRWTETETETETETDIKGFVQELFKTFQWNPPGQPVLYKMCKMAPVFRCDVYLTMCLINVVHFGKDCDSCMDQTHG